MKKILFISLVIALQIFVVSQSQADEANDDTAAIEKIKRELSSFSIDLSLIHI